VHGRECGANDERTAIEVPLSQVELHEDPNTQLYSGIFRFLRRCAIRVRGSGTLQEDDARKEPWKGWTLHAPMLYDAAPLYGRPGRLCARGVVLDRNGGKAGALRTEFTVPAPAEGPWLSDVALVRRMQPVAERPIRWSRLQYEKARVTPNLSHQVAAGTLHISFLLRMHGNPNLTAARADLSWMWSGMGIKFPLAMDVPGVRPQRII